jgi:signal transduction histidine kinase/CheY-like chemotaxis protein
MALLAREPISFELSRERGGVVRWCRATVCPIFRLSEHPQFCYYAEEITKQKAAEDELRRAKEAAEAANRAKTEFLANMSHEIRTPMTAILGFAETLLDAGQSAQERAQAVATIQRNGEHLMNVLNDILDLSKIEAGRMAVEMGMVELGEVLAAVAAALRPRAAKKGVAFSMEMAPGTPERLKTDGARLRQILLNLVGNAVKFTDKGHVRVTTRAAGTNVQVLVEDTGPGIDAATAATLFKPFVQADASASRRHGGTGLGLAIAQRLTELLGGRIEFRSKVGEGSVFIMTIPAGDAPQKVAAGAAAGGAGAPGRRLTGHVLLVEDSADTRALIAHFLTKAGLQVTAAEHGRQACDIAFAPGTPPVDLVLMDMQMPVMDGYSAARELRSRGTTCPIIALTANALKEDEERCREAGCTGYLTKPVERVSLVEAVGKWLVA